MIKSLIKVNNFIKDKNSKKLKPEFIQIFTQLANMGRLSTSLFAGAITHTVQGQFANMHNRSNTLMHFHPNIDTRLFTAKWRFVYSIEQDNIVCLSFFSRYGDLVYRVCSTTVEQHPEFKKFIDQFADIENTVPNVTENFTKSKYTKPIDKTTLLAKWSAMTNVHQASKIFKYYGNDPTTVYAALGENYAYKISTEKLLSFFNAIVEKQLDIMMFSRNYAAVQCYVGKVAKLIFLNEKINIAITNFEFVMNTNLLGDIWLVTKPTDSGFVNSISIFDKNDNEVLILTDKRTRGEPENTTWLMATIALKY